MTKETNNKIKLLIRDEVFNLFAAVGLEIQNLDLSKDIPRWEFKGYNPSLTFALDELEIYYGIDWDGTCFDFIHIASVPECYLIDDIFWAKWSFSDEKPFGPYESVCQILEDNTLHDIITWVERTKKKNLIALFQTENKGCTWAKEIGKDGMLNIQGSEHFVCTIPLRIKCDLPQI